MSHTASQSRTRHPFDAPALLCRPSKHPAVFDRSRLELSTVPVVIHWLARRHPQRQRMSQGSQKVTEVTKVTQSHKSHRSPIKSQKSQKSQSQKSHRKSREITEVT